MSMLSGAPCPLPPVLGRGRVVKHDETHRLVACHDCTWHCVCAVSSLRERDGVGRHHTLADGTGFKRSTANRLSPLIRAKFRCGTFPAGRGELGEPGVCAGEMPSREREQPPSSFPSLPGHFVGWQHRIHHRVPHLAIANSQMMAESRRRAWHPAVRWRAVRQSSCGSRASQRPRTRASRMRAASASVCTVC